MYPLKFKPIFKTVVWGGEKIAPFKGVSTSQDHIGESWELSAVKGDESVISNGEFAGMTITELAALKGAELLGGKVLDKTGTEFPLLIKFIDANGDLSIQVHPDDELSARRHGKKGKTEMWYVVGASEGAHLLAGLSEQITPEEYVSRVENDTITDVLCRYDVKPGDVFFLPAGRIHAICSGCFIAEIQQTSDVTYRIYDYNRPGLDGKPRQLHTQEARDAVDYTVLPDYRTHYQKLANQENVLVSCPYFTTSLYELDKAVSKDLSATDSFLVVMCTSGSAQIEMTEKSGDSSVIDIKQGETVLVPASASSVAFVPALACTLLTSCL